MLRVGVVGDPDGLASVAARRLGELVAEHPGVVLGGQGLHLVVGVGDVDPTAVDVRLDGAAAVDDLWARRVVPFEANLRNGTRAPRRRTPKLVASDPTWPAQAARLTGRLQEAVGTLVLRIDHIGSTSVPGLPAKDLLDLQVTVDDLATARPVAEQATLAGFVHVRGEWFGMDRFGDEHPEEVVVDADPGRPANVNIRPVTAPVWREAILFRDWLRSHPEERDAYAATKHALAGGGEHGVQVDTYSEAKMPWIRAAITRAETWAADTGWTG